MSLIEETPTVAWTDADTAQLRDLVADEDARQWQIGDLLIDRMPIGAHGVNTGVKAQIRLIAAEVGAEPATLITYRKVAHAWPEGMRIPSATYEAHQAYMGSPDSAADRRKTLLSLPRNEHGYITKQAVRDMTKGGGGRPSWLELVGRVGEDLVKAAKDMDRLEHEVDREPDQRMQVKLAEYAGWARHLAERFDALREWREVSASDITALPPDGS